MGRGWIAVDCDATLTEAPFTKGAIAPVSASGRRLLEMLKAAGYKVCLYTGHMNEERGRLDENVRMVEAWVAEQGIGHLVDRVWPHFKPDVEAVIDDKAVRWRGDPDLALVQARSACSWVDAYKAKLVKGGG